jgi:KDO2-lipid IV(A) lauroyltransferase
MTEKTETGVENRTALSRKKRIERAAGRFGLRLVVGPVQAMPLPMARAFGRRLGVLMFHALGRRRRVALKNLKLVYGALSDRERYAMARDVFRHFGEMAAEFIKIPDLGGADVDRLAVVEGEENLCRALEAHRGVLVVTGHFGNWEFLARWLTTHGYPLNVVARKANDPQADKLLTDTREGGGSQVFNRGNSARAVLASLKKNELVGLLPDQNAADVFVPFLGFPTGTVDGPAVIHLKTGAPLVFSWCVRLPDNRFAITFEPPEVVAPTGDRDADIARVMTLINARLEAQIRRHPRQWLWLHDRWKASPGVFPEGAEKARELKTPGNKLGQEICQADETARR